MRCFHCMKNVLLGDHRKSEKLLSENFLPLSTQFNSMMIILVKSINKGFFNFNFSDKPINDENFHTAQQLLRWWRCCWFFSTAEGIKRIFPLKTGRISWIIFHTKYIEFLFISCLLLSFKAILTKSFAAREIDTDEYTDHWRCKLFD